MLNEINENQFLKKHLNFAESQSAFFNIIIRVLQQKTGKRERGTQKQTQ